MGTPLTGTMAQTRAQQVASIQCCHSVVTEKH